MLDECVNIHARWTSFWPRLILAFHGLTLLMWGLALPRVIDSQYPPSLSVGTFVSFLLYAGMFMHPIEVIGMMARMLNRATSSAHRIFEVLDTEPKIVNRPDCVRLNPVVGKVGRSRM